MIGHDLLGELERVDSFLVERAKRLYAERPPDIGEFRGIFVSDQEFFELLQRPFDDAGLFPPSTPVSDSAPDPAESWHHLTQRFGLTAFEREALLICLLPEIALKYERIFAFLQDDITCKRPTVDLLLNLLSPTVSQRLADRSFFQSDAALRRHQLVRITPPQEGPDTLLRGMVQVEENVTRWLLTGTLPAQASDPPYWRNSDGHFDPSLYPSAQRPWIERLVLTEPLPLWVHVHTPARWTAAALAADLAAERGRPLRRLDLAAHLVRDEAIPSAVQSALRDAPLEDAVLLVMLPEDGNPETSALPEGWERPLLEKPLTIVWHVPDQVTPPVPSLAGLRAVRLTLPQADVETRQTLWRRALQDAPLADEADLPAVAARYRLDGGQIWAAAQLARQLGWQRHPQEGLISFDDLTAAARSVSTVHLGKLAQPITPKHLWDELVLPEDRKAQLAEMADHLRYRHIVYGEWGLGARSSRGQGLSALFAGPSGTGKTMAAEVLANDLALPLFKIDLSGVVSKYIGETEKNLDRIFERAQQADVILLFDEADALFGKRSETKDAHDRYANIEISYLLQKIEEYDGVVILTSNLRQNLDEAFLRRLQFSIEFPFPDREARRQIWERTIPDALPLADDVDLDALAERYRLSGGGIRNALVTAAFMAARDGAGTLSMAHLLWGVRREFQKLGKLIDENDFALQSLPEGLEQRGIPGGR